MLQVMRLLIVALALLATSAAVASAASASNFTASKYPTAATAISEKGNEDFKTEGAGVECRSHYAVAALEGPSETATVVPTYTECQALGFLSATIETEGCDYVLHTNGEVDIECPPEKSIRIASGTCELRIYTQTGLKSMTLSNNGTGIDAQANITGIAYTVTKDGFLCAYNGTGPKTGAGFIQNKAIQFSSTNGASIDIG